MKHTQKRLLSLLLSALLLSSCVRQGDLPAETTLQETEADLRTNPADLPAAAKNPTGAEADERFVTAVTDFSETLFRGCIDREDNLILSPLSLTYVLTLTSNGASGDTLREFEALNGGIPVGEMNEYLFWNALTLAAKRDSKTVVANSVWTDEGFPVNPQFRWIAEKYYNADAESLPFAEQSTADAINAWVSDKTDGMIPTVMDEPPADLVMLLCNTVLFDGKWETPYPDYSLHESTFRNADGTEHEVTMMYSHESTLFTGDGYTGFSKTYLDNCRFIAILPDEGTDVYELAASLDWSDAMDTALRGSHQSGDCYLPKFEAEWEMGLNGVLRDMGLTKAFTSEAELNGLRDGGGDGLYISSVRQKAKITVNETGTKAAAYSEVAVDECEHPSVRLDRPFLYAIADEETGIPLFLGITAYME